MDKIQIKTEFIKLDQFLKWAEVCTSGAEAKDMILTQKVKVNGEIEIRRGKKIRVGDTIEVFNRKFMVTGE